MFRIHKATEREAGIEAVGVCVCVWLISTDFFLGYENGLRLTVVVFIQICEHTKSH